jgi:hypothetical protein
MFVIDGVYSVNNDYKANGEVIWIWNCLDIPKWFISHNVYSDAGIALPVV